MIKTIAMDFLRKSIWGLTGILIALPLAVFGIVHWYEKKYDTLPYFGGNEMDKDGQQIQHIVADFQFINQDGKLFKSAAVTNNKIFIANFFFTSCGIVCPNMMQHLKQVQTIYLKDKNIAFVSFTVDPERDSAIRLKRYAQEHQINNLDWDLLTGGKKEIYKLARKSFYLSANDGDGGEDDFIHSEQLVLIDKNKHIRGYYEGTDDNAVEQLKIDIKKLEHEN